MTSKIHATKATNMNLLSFDVHIYIFYVLNVTMLTQIRTQSNILFELSYEDFHINIHKIV